MFLTVEKVSSQIAGLRTSSLSLPMADKQIAEQSVVAG